MPKVLCAGRLYCDLIFTDVPRLPSMGTEVYAGGLGLHPGGGAFITGAYLASLGHAAGLACVLPAAPFDGALQPAIAATGLSLGLCAPPASGQDPQVTVAIAGAEDRAFLTRRAGAAAPDLAAGDLAGIAHLHVGELASLIEKPALLEAARGAGATISLDCGWEDDIDAQATAALLPLVDVFLPNQSEVEALQARGIAADLAPLTVIKQGAAGATAITQGQEVRAQAQAVEVVDTTGAGDAFNAGFLSAWLAGKGLQACLNSGNALGAHAISGRGGFHR